MNTEITDNNARQPDGSVFYDGECRRCLAWAEQLRGTLGRRQLSLLPLQSPEANRQLGMTGSARLVEMRLLLADGRNLGGAEAMVEIARRIWWAWPLWAISRFPRRMPVLRAAYRVLAANRHCANGVCLITQRAKSLDWLPLVVLPAAAIAIRATLPDWVFMWVLAFAIFFGCKWLTLRRACKGRGRPGRLSALAYLLLWPGMDAEPFLTGHATKRPAHPNWAAATAKSFAGVALLWFVTAGTLSIDPSLLGWLGMIGVVLLLHFGLIHLLALCWQTTGRGVKPVMRAPLLATKGGKP